MRIVCGAAYVIVGLLVIGACVSQDGRAAYRTVSEGTGRNSLAAERLNRRGLRAVEDGEPAAAERFFRESLSEDLYYAPAHNNLGLILVQTDRHYEAAWEFDYAAKLVPRALEPRANLGLLYERVGQLDRAMDAYEAALKIEPENLVTMRHLARAMIKADRRGDRLKTLLERLLQVPGDTQWDAWVRGQVIRVGRPEGEMTPVRFNEGR